MENGKPRVLLVDDEPPVLGALARALREEPYEPLATTRREEALLWVQRSEISLVISDQRIPAMCGIDLLSEIRRKSPGTEIALLTGYPAPSLLSRADDRQIPLILRKPWEEEGLREAILQTLLKRVPRIAETPEPLPPPVLLTIDPDGTQELGVAPEPDPEPEVPLRRTHVLVCVDDDPTILRALRRTLRDEPYRLLTTTDPARALRWLEEGDVSLLISDQRKPAMTGTELLEEAEKRSARTRRIILTSYPVVELILESGRRGADWLLSKPWLNEELCSLIRRILRERERKDEEAGGRDETVRRFHGEAWLRKWRVSDLRESLIAVQCDGRDPADVLERLGPKPRRAESVGIGVNLVLHELPSLHGSVPKFLHALAPRLCAFSVRVNGFDPSGASAVCPPEAAEHIPSAAYGPPPGSSPAGRALVVEHDPGTSEFLQLVLRSLNLECRAASDPGGTAAAIEACEPDFVLLLRDVLARSLFGKYQADFALLNRVLDAYEPAANRIANTVGVSFVQERERIIRQQQEAIGELPTPVLQVRERLLILPIIGVIDAQRARQITEQLVRGIRANRAKAVVIDIPGVPSVDSTVANHLVQTVDASRLMGASVIVTGLSSEIAQTLVTIGVDLGKINAVGDLQGGIEEGLAFLDQKSKGGGRNGK